MTHVKGLGDEDMRKSFMLVVFIFFCMIFLHNTAHAQYNSTTTPLRVGLYISSPFVTLMNNGVFQGMAVELWETITKPLGVSSEYILYHDFKELIDATERHDIDVLLSSFTVTHERAIKLAISYPWFDAGMRIMVNREHHFTLFERLLESGRIGIYLCLTTLVVILTVLLTLVRRKIDANFTHEWKTGLATSLHDLILAAKSGRISPIYFGWIGYLLSAAWMLIGVAIIAYVTSTLTTAMTFVSLQTEINSLLDLRGRSVGVISGGLGYDFLHSMGIATKSYEEVDDAINDLHAKKLDAVFDDAPVLEYVAYTRPELEFNVVGNLLFPGKYAFAANKVHEELMAAVSLEIIKMNDNGELVMLKNKYFGPPKL